MQQQEGITGVPMRPRRAARRSSAAAIAAALWLAGGASGEEARPAAPPAAPSCQASGEAAAPRVDTAALLEQIRRSEARRPPGATRVEALDNRGTAYGPAPDPLADLPLREPR
jgi:hypothetical protein